MSERWSDPGQGPGAPEETAAYAAEIAHELTLICEQAGLVSLSTLFYAASAEAERIAHRLAKATMAKPHRSD